MQVRLDMIAQLQLNDFPMDLHQLHKKNSNLG